MESRNFMKTLLGICATALSAVYLVYISNLLFGYIPVGNFFHSLIGELIYYGPLSLCALCSISLVWRKGIIWKVVVIAVWALIIIFSFFPGLFAQLF